VGHEAARDLLRAHPVDQERQVRTVLLDRAERQEHDGAGVAREGTGVDPRALGEPDGTGRGAARARGALP
jgi:hypothetical protein